MKKLISFALLSCLTMSLNQVVIAVVTKNTKLD